MTDVAARLRARLDELRASGPAPGRAWCREATNTVDAALMELYGTVGDHPGRAVVAAVGGYGRSELCPGSDIDLLLLVDGVPDADLERLVRAVVYPLWDASLQVGYAVRTPSQATAQVKAEVDDATAILDARTVVGDGALLSDVRRSAVAILAKKPARLLTPLADADLARRDRAGDAAEALEPDVKDGAGGLRDVQSLRWAAAAVVGTPGLDPLVSGRYLGADDRGRLARAYDDLLATRVALHLVTEDKRNVLRLDLQDAVAERLGIPDGDDDRDTRAHRLLTRHYLAARTVEHVHARAWRLLASDASRGRRLRRPAEQVVDGFEIVDGVLRLPGEPTEALEADAVMRLLATLAATGAVLDRETAAGLRRAVQGRDGESLVWTPSARARFLEVLWTGAEALPALAELDDVGLITLLIPEWAPLRARAQRNPFHLYSLDRHAWHAAAELAEIVRTNGWAERARSAVGDDEVLMLGVLLHDVGKAHGEPHSETGVPIARAICLRLGLTEGQADWVGDLVRQHLLLPDIATRRDLADPELAAAVAEDVATPQHLAALHLLAAADGRATGPTAWTSWKGSLVETLVTRVRAVLDDRDPEKTAEGSVTTTDEARSIAPSLGAETTLVDHHLSLLPDRYAAAVTPRAIVRHALAAEHPLGPAQVRCRVTPGPDAEASGYDVLDVVAMDRPGLFAKVAGVLSLHGASIVQAHAFTRDDGVAVDSFTVDVPDEAGGSWWAAVEADIDEAMAGRLALRARVRRKTASQHRKLKRLPDVERKVTVGEDLAGTLTVLEIHAVDRIGLLFEITSALAELELDIVVAKISTIGHEAIDAFYVRDHNGKPLDDDHAREAALAVDAAIHALEVTAERPHTP